MIRRLDFKIVFILLVTVLVPLSVSAVLVLKALDTSLGLGLNEDLAMQLRRAVDMHRTHIQDLKEEFRSCFAHLVDSEQLTEAATFGDEQDVRDVLREFIDRNHHLKAVQLTWAEDAASLTVTADAPYEIADARNLSLTDDFPVGPFSRIEAVFEVEGAIERNFKEAGEIHDTYQALLSAPPNYLKNRFILAYFAVLNVAVIISILVGIFLARRITRRIHLLSTATARVATGDLTVRMESGSGDEVGRLVTAFNDMVAELSTSRARIEYLQKISAWQEIARRLAHEIKNPLTPIRLAAQQLEEKYNGEDPRFGSLLEQSVEIIKEEVETLRRLTSDFAAFAKLPKVDPNPLDLTEFLRECESSIGPVTEQDGVEIHFNIGAANRRVSIDRIMMKRVIDNLVRNAAEVLRESDTPNPKITVSARATKSAAGPEVEIRVTDNGPGVPEAYRQSIFDPYFTTKSEGTGLGLAISKKIVLEHGGRIFFDEKNDTGATFTVLLPALS